MFDHELARIKTKRAKKKEFIGQIRFILVYNQISRNLIFNTQKQL